MSKPARVCIDASVFIAVFNQEPGRFEISEHVLTDIREKRIRAVCPSLLAAEVWDVPPQFSSFEDFLLTLGVKIRALDLGVAGRLRHILRFLRATDKIGSQIFRDAVYYATALEEEADSLFTWDINSINRMSVLKDGPFMSVPSPVYPIVQATLPSVELS